MLMWFGVWLRCVCVVSFFVMAVGLIGDGGLAYAEGEIGDYTDPDPLIEEKSACAEAVEPSDLALPSFDPNNLVAYIASEEGLRLLETENDLIEGYIRIKREEAWQTFVDKHSDTSLFPNVSLEILKERQRNFKRLEHTCAGMALLSAGCAIGGGMLFGVPAVVVGCAGFLCSGVIADSAAKSETQIKQASQVRLPFEKQLAHWEDNLRYQARGSFRLRAVPASNVAQPEEGLIGENTTTD